MLAKEEESVFKSSSWCWRDGEQLARCCGVIWREVWDEKAKCTDLAVEGARVGDVFLGLVRIHWVGLIEFLGCRGWEVFTSESLRDLCYPGMVSKTRSCNPYREEKYLSGLKVPSVSD